MRRYLYTLLRKLLDEFRAKREYLRPIGFILFRYLDPKNVRVARANEDDIKPLETFLSSGDLDKHRKRLEDQREGSVEYLIAWYLVPVGHAVIIWEGGNDGPLRYKTEREPLIEDVYIHPAARGKGVGKILMEEAETLVRERGYNKVGVEVLISNPSVEMMYRKRGYENTDLGVFESSRIFTDKKGRERTWSAKVKYLTKRLEN